MVHPLDVVDLWREFLTLRRLTQSLNKTFRPQTIQSVLLSENQKLVFPKNEISGDNILMATVTQSPGGNYLALTDINHPTQTKTQTPIKLNYQLGGNCSI